MKTYYKISGGGNSAINPGSKRGSYRIQSHKPEDHTMATGDRVFTIRAENIQAARDASPSAWTRQPSMEL